MGTTKEKFDRAFASKEDLRLAINEKGQPVTVSTPFSDYAAGVRAIKQASAEKPVIAVSPEGLITATAGDQIATQQLTTQAGQTIIPGTLDKTIPLGRFTTGNQVVKGDPNLIAENIKTGVTIFGVVGGAESYIEETFEDALVLTKTTEEGQTGYFTYEVSLTLRREPKSILVYETEAAVKYPIDGSREATISGLSVYFPRAPISPELKPVSYVDNEVRCWYLSFFRDSVGSAIPRKVPMQLELAGKTVKFSILAKPEDASYIMLNSIQASFARVLYIPK